MTTGLITEGDQNLSAERQRWAAERATRSETLERDDRSFFHQILSTPCLDEVVSASGPWITTASGRRLLDFHGNSVHQIGFAHPEVLAAVQAQAAALPYCTRRYTNLTTVELAERLIATAPGTLARNARVLLAPSGSAAVGIALKIARAVTGRHKTIAFRDSFHGATLDVSSVGGQDLFRRGMGIMLPGTMHAPPPNNQSCERRCGGRCDSSCVSAIERLLEENPDTAAILAEPVRATTVHAAPSGYWQRVRAACDRTGTLLIFDEIPTGLGRTGRFWSTEHTGVTPDLIVLGKGLGGAVFPQAAVIGRADLNDTGSTPVRELALGHYTHEKSPIGSAAALATLRVIEREGLVDRSRDIGDWWTTLLRARLGHLRSVTDIRALGLMVGVELTDPDHADRAMYESLRRGLSFKVGGGTTLVLFPPLNTDQPTLELAAEILAAAIESTA